MKVYKRKGRLWMRTFSSRKKDNSCSALSMSLILEFYRLWTQKKCNKFCWRYARFPLLKLSYRKKIDSSVNWISICRFATIILRMKKFILKNYKSVYAETTQIRLRSQLSIWLRSCHSTRWLSWSQRESVGCWRKRRSITFGSIIHRLRTLRTSRFNWLIGRRSIVSGRSFGERDYLTK